MKIGINTLLWTANFDTAHLPLLEQIKAHGFDSVEIARFEWASFPAIAIRRELDRLGLGLTFCTALTGAQSLASEDASVRAATIQYLKDAIEVVGSVGSKVLAGPFCTAVGQLLGRRRTEEEWKRVVGGLQSLAGTLDATGVNLGVEPLNRFEAYFLNTAADAARLCDEVAHPGIGVLYDTFHANIEEKQQGPAIRSVAKHLKHVHTCENDRGIPGSGHVDWDGTFAALKAIGYDGHLVIESFGFAIPEIVAAACIWRDLAPTPDDIAWEGIKFLRARLTA